MNSTRFGRNAFVVSMLALVVPISAGATQVNLVTNGSFQTGDFTGWTENGWHVWNAAFGVTPSTGDNYFAANYCNIYCSLTQTISTVAGQEYDITFSFNPGRQANSLIEGDTRVYFGPADLAPVNTTTPPTDGIIAEVGVGSLGWTSYTIEGVVASSDSTALDFLGYQHNAVNGLDDVSVTAVPLPGGLTMLFTACVGLFGFAAHRQRGAAAGVLYGVQYPPSA